MNLPLNLPWNLAQNRWASLLNPFVSNPFMSGLQLMNVNLVSGANVVNHTLGRKLQGWLIVGINAPVTVYDTQATNSMPQLTLNLVSSGTATANLYVY